jgi:hypothetical protein
MSKPVRLTVRGRSADTDAPTVEDLLAQVRDWFDILQGVEKAIAEDGASEIEWRVTSACKASPLAFELTPFARQHGMNVERRARATKEHASAGIRTLRDRAERPSYFTESVLESAERLFERVTNGLDLTAVDFGDEFPSIEITPADAKVAASNVLAVRKPKDKPYQEIGSIEGTLQSAELDGYRRALLHVKLRINGETVKCIVPEVGQADVERHSIGEVWKSQRVRVLGTIYHRSLGHISQIVADAVQFLQAPGELPSASDIVNENFTGGLKSEDYLEKLRNGELS